MPRIPQPVRDALLFNPQLLRALKAKIGRNPLTQWDRLDPNTQMMIVQNLELKGAPFAHTKTAYIGSQARFLVGLREGRDFPRETLIYDKHRPTGDVYGDLDDDQRAELINLLLQSPKEVVSPSMNSLSNLAPAREQTKGTLKIAQKIRRSKVKLDEKMIEDFVRTVAAGGVLGGIGYIKGDRDTKKTKREKIKGLLKAIGKGATGSATTFAIVRSTDLLSKPLARQIIHKLKKKFVLQ